MLGSGPAPPSVGTGAGRQGLTPSTSLRAGTERHYCPRPENRVDAVEVSTKEFEFIQLFYFS